MQSFLQAKALAAFMAFFALTSFSLLEERGLVLTGALLAGGMALILVWRKMDWALPLALAALIAMPFFLGVSRTPKIFLDEMLFLLLLGVVPLKLLFGREQMRLGVTDILTPILALGLMCLTTVYNVPGMVALRALLETLGLGVFLCLLCAQESNEERLTRISLFLCTLAIGISVAGIVESALQYNPLLEYYSRTAGEDEFLYLSPETAQSTGGVYRPYVTFFHPSEGATVLALCLPFIGVLRQKPEKMYQLLVFTAFALSAGYLFINSTRGVWAALAVTSLIFLPRFRRLALLCAPVGVFGILLVVLFLSETAYFDRLLNPRNLLIRFFFWDIGLSHLSEHWFMGLGFGNFQNVYLSLNPAIPIDILADVEQVNTLDNTYLMVLVEQGLIGFIGLALFLGFLMQRLSRAHASLLGQNRPLAVGFVRAGQAALTIFLLCGLLADVHLFTKATKLCFALAGLGWGLSLHQKERDWNGSNSHYV